MQEMNRYMSSIGYNKLTLKMPINLFLSKQLKMAPWASRRLELQEYRRGARELELE